MFLFIVRWLFLLVVLVGVPIDRQGCSLMFLGVSIEGANERRGGAAKCVCWEPSLSLLQCSAVWRSVL